MMTSDPRLNSARLSVHQAGVLYLLPLTVRANRDPERAKATEASKVFSKLCRRWPGAVWEFKGYVDGHPDFPRGGAQGAPWALYAWAGGTKPPQPRCEGCHTPLRGWPSSWSCVSCGAPLGSCCVDSLEVVLDTKAPRCHACTLIEHRGYVSVRAKHLRGK